MVVDTSAIVAAIGQEPDAAAYREAMLSVASVTISSVTALEARMVLHARHGPDAVSAFQEMLEDFSIVVVPFDSSLAMAVFDAFLRFGKGRHPASLNIVDCAAYATARTLGEPLLFKGNDFSRTDVAAVL
jgi:ribonuclease VapC